MNHFNFIILTLTVVVGLSACSEVEKPFDNKNLNLDVPFLAGIKSSTENVAIAIWEQLETEINATGCQLHCIKLYETENNFVEYYGGK